MTDQTAVNTLLNNPMLHRKKLTKKNMCSIHTQHIHTKIFKYSRVIFNSSFTNTGPNIAFKRSDLVHVTQLQISKRGRACVEG